MPVHPPATPQTLVKQRSPRTTPSPILTGPVLAAPQAVSSSASSHGLHPSLVPSWTRNPNMVQVVFEIFWLRPEANTTLWIKVDVPSCENGVRLAPPRNAGKPYTTTCLLPAEQRLQWWVGIEHDRDAIEWTLTPRKLFTKGVTFVCHVLWGPSTTDTALHYMQARMDDWQKAGHALHRPSQGQSSARRSTSMHDSHIVDKYKSAFHPHSSFSKSHLNSTIEMTRPSPRQQLSESIIPEEPHEHSVSFVGSDLSSAAVIQQLNVTTQPALEGQKTTPSTLGPLASKDGSPSPSSEVPSVPSEPLTSAGPHEQQDRDGSRMDKKWGWWSK